jgi:prolycopene isomerase
VSALVASWYTSAVATRDAVIVVGAGLGGLSAAALLAREGLDVLVLERHNVPGGYATSFVRGRFELEVALHQLSGIGSEERRGPLYEYLAGLGVTDDVAFATLPHLYRSVFPGLDVTVPAGWERLEAWMCDTFARDAAGIRRFLGRVRDTARDFGRLAKQRGRLGHPVGAVRRFPSLLRYLPATWAAVLEADVRDPRARAVLSQYWGYVGLPPRRASFVNLALTLYAYGKLGPAYPVGRSQALSHALERAVESHGGRVLTNRGVRRIEVADGRVRGVVTQGGERFAAEWLVSNADPFATCRELLDPADVPAGWLASRAPRAIAASTVNVYLGLDRPPSAFGATEHEIFVNADLDLEGHAAASHRLEAPREVAVTCYNAVCPDISPAGTTMIALCALSYGAAWAQVRPGDYLATKARLAESMLALTERVLPGLRAATEVMEVSTPLTNLRYTGAMGGSIYGFDATPAASMMTRPSNVGPVEGLVFAGAWTQPGGGFEPAIMSGAMAAGRILAARRRLTGGGRGR